MGLYRLLCAEFSKLGFAVSAPAKFKRHLTILYDQKELTPKSIPSVCWLVKEIVIVLSEVGETKYRRLGCWAETDDGFDLDRTQTKPTAGRSRFQGAGLHPPALAEPMQSRMFSTEQHRNNNQLTPHSPFEPTSFSRYFQ